MKEQYTETSTVDFNRCIAKMISRRDFLQRSALGLSGFAAAATLPNISFANTPSAVLGFNHIAANSHDTVTLATGYNWNVLVSWGDPLFPQAPVFDNDTRGNSTSQMLAFGDNNDGMALFPISDDHAVVAINNEYINMDSFYPNGKVASADDVKKCKAAHGVSVFEIKKTATGGWQIHLDGQRNRRITADTPMMITGPARGNEHLHTAADPNGILALGTWNNCGNGQTPWGTYLTCEENFNSYFASDDSNYTPTTMHTRYGVGVKDRGYSWYKYDRRFDISKSPNEPNRCGYIVEIDPHNPDSMPKKLTALGRFKHENAEVVVASNGQVVVYMGDDERGEYLYKFVSNNKYQPGDTTHNSNLLDEGKLYVARFDPTDKLAGDGHWIELRYGINGLDKANGFNNQAEVCIFARHAATVVRATTMDRPEWVAAHPHKAEVYCTLTNNKNRGIKKNAGGVEQVIGGPNPRKKNIYGQIVRWRPANGDHLASDFIWDLFVIAGNPSVHATGLKAGSNNITAENMFNSPDGIKFDNGGRLWIQTDGKYSNKGEFAGMGNNQMLCADTQTGEIRRFMVGPIACEITGAMFTADHTTMFVGIQHPGEKNAGSSFPGGGATVPRSSVIAIRKNDGGVIGS